MTSDFPSNYLMKILVCAGMAQVRLGMMRLPREEPMPGPEQRAQSSNTALDVSSMFPPGLVPDAIRAVWRKSPTLGPRCRARGMMRPVHGMDDPDREQGDRSS
jgi:hypothetical protein